MPPSPFLIAAPAGEIYKLQHEVYARPGVLKITSERSEDKLRRSQITSERSEDKLRRGQITPSEAR